MITIKYKVGLSLKGDSTLTKKLNEQGVKQSIRQYPTLEGIRLEAFNTPNISRGYIPNPAINSKLLIKDGFLYGQHENKQQTGAMSIEGILLTDFSFKEHGRYIVEHALNPLPSGLVESDDVLVLRVPKDNTSPFWIDPEMYTINYKDGVIEWSPDYPEEYKKECFLWVRRHSKKYEPVDNLLDITVDDILRMDSGFYQALPSIYKKGNELLSRDKDNKITLKVRNLTHLSSDMVLSYDGCSLSNFLVLGGHTVTLSYGEDYTPLNDVTFSKDREYIVYSPEGTPTYYLSANNRENDDSTWTAVLNSHYEYKRPYKVVANKAIVRDKSDSNKELSYEVLNPYFKTLTKDKNLIKLKLV